MDWMVFPRPISSARMQFRLTGGDNKVQKREKWRLNWGKGKKKQQKKELNQSQINKNCEILKIIQTYLFVCVGSLTMLLHEPLYLHYQWCLFIMHISVVLVHGAHKNVCWDKRGGVKVKEEKNKWEKENAQNPMILKE